MLIEEARARARRRRRKIALAVVGAAALAAGVLAATGGFSGTRPGPRGRGTGPSAVAHQLTPPGGMPSYYVVVAGHKAVVHASGDGHVTGSVSLPVPAGTPLPRAVEMPAHRPLPVPAGTPRDLVSGEPFGGTDGRHFVITVSRGGDLPGVDDVTVYRLTVSPGGRPGQLIRVNFASRGVPVTGAALSPDGRMLALSLTHEFPGGPLYGSVEVISLTTGTARTWTGRGAPGYWPGVPSWAGNGTVAVPWWHSASQSMLPADLAGVRELDPAAPGGSLLAARLVAFPAPVRGLESAVIAPGGGEIIASSCRAGQHHTVTARVVGLSAADGRLVRVLRTQTARFRGSAGALDMISSTCQVLSVAGHGGYVLAQAFAFGRIDNGAFTPTPLPGTSPGDLQVSAAW